MVKRTVKNRIRSNNLRTVRKHFPRFIALTVMSFLGVFVFAGLMATAPDMIGTLDDYLDSRDAYDFRVVSTLGLTAEDVDALRAVEGVERAEGGRALDTEVFWGGDDAVCNVASLPVTLNRVELLEGRLPETPDELLVEPQFLVNTGLALGDRVRLDSDSFREREVTLVGTCDSALYYNNVMLDQNRGSTNIGSGKISYYCYTVPEAFDLDCYTVIYLQAAGAKEPVTSEAAYTALTDALQDRLEEIKPEREYARYRGIYDDAEREIDDARADADAELADARAELDDAKAELDDAKITLTDSRGELDDAKKTLADSRAELDDAKNTLTDSRAELDDAKQQLADGKAQLKDAQQELRDAARTLRDSRAQLNDAKTQLDGAAYQLIDSKRLLNDARAQLNGAEAEYNNALQAAGLTPELLEPAIAQLQQAIASVPAGMDAMYALQLAQWNMQLQGLLQLRAAGAELDAAEKEYRGNLTAYERGKAAYDRNRAAYEESEAEFGAGFAEWTAGKASFREENGKYRDALREYEDGEQEYADGLKKYEDGEQEYADGLREYEDGEREYADGLKEYEDGLAEYEDGLREYNDAVIEADEKIADARAELDELEMPEWFITGRDGYATYTDYIDDSNSIRNLGKLFPVVFFAVAVLVSLTSMNRMVEEDRLEIGTLKSMGFAEPVIMSKYLVFSLLATVTGGLLGAAGGLIVIPELIFHIYKILFTLPALKLTLQPLYTILGFAITVLCVCGSAVWTAFKVLREKPGELLRGKAPKSGGKILLERVTFLWKRISFSKKVTIRNLFRYKKRALVTVGGIAGCTALMLTGFGVKDAVADVAAAQYYGIYRFDGIAAVASADTGAGEGVPLSLFTETEGIGSAVFARRISTEIEGMDGYLLVVDADDLRYVASFKNTVGGEPLSLEPGKVIVSEKLATMNGLKAGDTVTATDADNRSYALPISAVTDNYIEHFMYMTPETYENAGGEYRPNLVYFQTGELTQEQKDEIAGSLLKNEDILSVNFTSTLIDNVENSLKSLDSVVLILIVLSAALAFTVLYNLSNININERRRELATLKVLGFYDREVDSYINKETLILTGLGIALGLVLGIFLCRAVVNTVEVDKARFINVIKPMSYVWSALISSVFAAVVVLITHRVLKKIDMIDSLKSME